MAVLIFTTSSTPRALVIMLAAFTTIFSIPLKGNCSKIVKCIFVLNRIQRPIYQAEFQSKRPKEMEKKISSRFKAIFVAVNLHNIT
jgi:hypothetical protein